MSALGSDTKHLPIPAVLHAYLLGLAATDADAVEASLYARTAAAAGADAGMAVPPEQARLLTLLARLVGARFAVDLGTFTGISALALARGLAPGGRVLTCDVSDRYLDLAREHWIRAGMAERIDFRLGPAERTLATLPETVDIIFVDADKLNYPRYYRRAMASLRPGGLLVLDNVLLDGYVVAPELAPEPLLRKAARTLRDLNAEVAADERLDVVTLPVADGLTIARRRHG